MSLRKTFGRLSKRLNLPKVGGYENSGKVGGVLAALSGDPMRMMSSDVLGARAGKSGTRSADQEADQNALAKTEATAEAEQNRLAAAAEVQRKKDEEAERAKAARDALRESQTGGYAANILAGRSGGFGGGASRRLYGS